jgi:hypothetical protein
MSTPPLLRKMNERQVGELVIYNRRIIEPLSQCCVAHSFPNNDKAAAAAAAMNEVADWFGIIKTRAEGGRPNCQDELERIAIANGGKLGDGAGQETYDRCTSVVQRKEQL